MTIDGGTIFMASRSKIKGSTAERDIVNYLRASGWPHAERRLAGAADDRGDIAGVVGICIEVKNCARMELAGWVDEAVLEQANSKSDYGVVWHKRRGKPNPADWFVTLTGGQFAQLLHDAGYGRAPKEPRP